MFTCESIEALSPNSEILLTSAGPTTGAIQERILEMGRTVGRLSDLEVLRISDGWTPFSPDDGVSLAKRLEQRVGSVFAKSWSTRYLGHILGKANVETHSLGELDESQVEELIQRSDMLVVPGGNTWQTMRGLNCHRNVIRRAVSEGLPYFGESAGSIVAGQTTSSAGLEPADTLPNHVSVGTELGLGLLDGDIVVHSIGREEDFDIPGIQSRLASRVLRGYETPQTIVARFIEQMAADGGTPTTVLNDAQALSISDGVATIL